MNGDGLSSEASTKNGSQPNISSEKIVQHQERIYYFFLKIVHQYSPEEVLKKFKILFFEYHSAPDNSRTTKAIDEIIASNNERNFINTIKRCCYILINNWEIERHYSYIHKLVESFAELELEELEKFYNKEANRREIWLLKFINSQDYQDLKLFAGKYNQEKNKHWSDRYTAYLLSSQYANTDNPKEQRDAAKVLAQQLQQEFKFDLAMYTARSQCKFYQKDALKNPTSLGEEVLNLIKIIIAKRGEFNHVSLANIFLKQIRDLNYQEFKKTLYNYLIFKLGNSELLNNFKQKLLIKINALYKDYEDENIDNSLLLRSCNRLFENLTTENHQEPSELFIQSISLGSPLTLVIILLKLILISPYSRIYLDNQIAELIKYYMDYPESDCRWIVNFFEVLNVVFAIYADKDVEYNLIRMKQGVPEMEQDITEDDLDKEALETYRIFSQRLHPNRKI